MNFELKLLVVPKTDPDKCFNPRLTDDVTALPATEVAQGFLTLARKCVGEHAPLPCFKTVDRCRLDRRDWVVHGLNRYQQQRYAVQFRSCVSNAKDQPSV